MPKALMTITSHLLAQILALPDDAVVYPDDIVILVEHPDIPAEAKTVTPTFQRLGDGRVTFIEWGAK